MLSRLHPPLFIKSNVLNNCVIITSKLYASAASAESNNDRLQPSIDDVDYGQDRIRLGAHRLPPVLTSRLRYELHTNNVPLRAVKADARQIVTRFSHMALPVERDDARRLESHFSQVFSERAESRGRPVDGKQLQHRVDQRVKMSVGRHQPIAYDTLHACGAYAVARSSAEYASARRVLAEVRQDAGNAWQPHSALDFGSGIGTLYWAAADIWPRQSEMQDVTRLADARLDPMAHEQSPRGPPEYLMVDRSPEMLTLSRLLIQGRHQIPADQPNPLLQRANIVRDANTSFDLVMCAYTLLDLHSFAERASLIEALWQLTGSYLVLIERGTYSGFRTIIEARDRIIALGNISADEPQYMDADMQPPAARSRDQHNQDRLGHVVAPCAHQFRCPRTQAKRWRPCHFPVHYERSEGLRLATTDKEPVQKEMFSYLVMKKGHRMEPYLARALTDPYQRKSKSVSLQVCAPDGNLKVCRFSRSSHDARQRTAVRRIAAGDALDVPHWQIQ